MKNQNRNFDVIVLGAGAAGLFCAAEAAKRGRRVAVLERAERVGKKILISGGGRCNFTNIHCKPENFLSANPHFAKSALARYTPADFIKLVEKHKIPYHEKKLGQLFCDRSAEDITNMLETECQEAGVQIYFNCRVAEVRRTTEYLVHAEAEEFRAKALVVATGGLSIPKMGATDFGYRLAKQFGLRIKPTRPALVPLVLGKREQKYCELAGVSAEVTARAGETSFTEKMLFTHRGVSGPAILQISSYWSPGESIFIDIAPGHQVTAQVREYGPRTPAGIEKAFQGILPQRFAERWVREHSPQSWTNASLDELEQGIHHWTLKPVDTEGYGKAEVTAGGVDTDELSSKTMECRNVPGLYFIGEVVDVTGQLGGFNFQWAWASAAAAGRSM